MTDEGDINVDAREGEECEVKEREVEEDECIPHCDDPLCANEPIGTQKWPIWQTSPIEGAHKFNRNMSESYYLLRHARVMTMANDGQIRGTEMSF